MPARLRMFARVTIWRAVATKCDAALLTRAQMHPIVSTLYTLGTFLPLRVFDRFDRFEVRTIHSAVPSHSRAASTSSGVS